MHILRNRANASIDLKNVVYKTSYTKFTTFGNHTSKFKHLECINLKGLRGLNLKPKVMAKQH
jgi:hypothetical protein